MQSRCLMLYTIISAVASKQFMVNLSQTSLSLTPLTWLPVADFAWLFNVILARSDLEEFAIKFAIKDFFGKRDQIRNKLRIW